MVGELADAMVGPVVVLDEVDRLIGRQIDEGIARPLSQPAVAEFADELALGIPELIEEDPLRAVALAEDEECRAVLDGDRGDVAIGGDPRRSVESEREAVGLERDARRPGRAAGAQDPATTRERERVGHPGRSPPSSIGTRMPRSRATSIARS